MRLPRHISIYAVFVASGVTSLAYEVVWARMLIRVFGATSFAVTTVLASYMAGLALGSFIFGKLIDREEAKREEAKRAGAHLGGIHPVRIYGFLELGVGAFALIFPLIVAGLNSVYRAAYQSSGGNYDALTVLRFTLSFIVLLIPTTLMGGTLPILSKYLTRVGPRLAGKIGALYAVNTFGAVFGAFAAGYILLPNLGISRTTWLCAAVNGAIFAAAWLLSGEAARRREAARRGEAAELERAGEAEEAGEVTASMEEGHTQSSQEAGAWQSRLVLIAFMMTGFAALAAEVLWTRVLALVIGTTVYAFSAMLTTFLLGLALGSAVFSRIADRNRRPGLMLGLVVAAIGVTVFLTSIAFGRLPMLYMDAGQRFGWGWGQMMWAQFLLCLLVTLVPTFLMGGTFPLVARIYVRRRADVGSRVGTAYAFNTVGSIFGSFAGSFLFLAAFGVEKSLSSVSAIYLAVGVALVAGISGLGRTRRLAAVGAIAALAIAVFILAPGWNPKLMTSGVYRYARMYRTGAGLEQNLRDKLMLYYNDGPGATVTVERYQDELALGIDGKADASTGSLDMTTQTLLAHLPLVFHPRPDTVLVIGLGCGMTLGSAERYPARSVDCIELLRNVTVAARYFNDFNYSALGDPRLRLIVADARNQLLLSPQTYDVIISEPTNPWIAGVGDLFTREFFELARRRLKPDGIICAWFHLYQMGDKDLRSMAKTFLSVFPNASMWMANESDVIFIGSVEPLKFDQALEERFAAPKVSGDLGRIRVKKVSDILSSYIWGSDGVARYAAGADKMQTDDNMMLEYSASKRLFQNTAITHLSNFLRSMEIPPLADLRPEVQADVRRQIEARKTALQGSLAFLGGRPDEGIGYYNEAYRAAPDDPYVISVYVDGNQNMAYSYAERGNLELAIATYAKAVAEPDYPRAWETYDGLAFCYARLGNLSEARRYYEASLAANAYNRSSSHNLARLDIAAGDTSAAGVVYERLLTLFPDDAEGSDGLARMYAARGRDLDRALGLARLAVSSDKKAPFYNTLGWVYYLRGNLEEAREALDASLALAPDNSEALFRLALVEDRAGRRDEATQTLRHLLGLGRRDEYTDRATALLREMGAR